MRVRIVRILKWFIVIVIALFGLLVVHNQYTIERYMSKNKSRFDFLEGRNRKVFIPFTVYDIRSLVSAEKKKEELQFCEELFKKHGYPMKWSPNRDTYLISIHYSRQEKKKLLQKD